jgi:hypothetical protein
MQKFLSASSLRMGYDQRLSSSLGASGFVGLQIWLMQAGFTTKTVVLGTTIIRLQVRKKMRDRTVVSRMISKREDRRTSRSLQISVSKVGEGALILPAVSGAVGQDIR